MTTPNKIALEGMRYEEASCAAAFYPGHLLMTLSDGTVQKHNVFGGRALVLVAEEQALIALTINDAYATGDLARMVLPGEGQHLLMRVPAHAVAIAQGNQLVSNGDGTLVKNPGSNNFELYSNDVDSAAIANTTVATAFAKSYSIPANSLSAGDVLKIRAAVKCPATNSTDTLTLALLIGTTTIVATAAVDVANNDEGYIDCAINLRTVGATGTFVANGTQSLGTPGTATLKPFHLASTAIDTTVAQLVSVQATWSVANAGDSAVLENLTVELERNLTTLFEAVEALDNSAGAAEAFLRVRVIA